MLRYLIRRLFQTAALLLVVSLVVFTLVLQAPGGSSILLDRNMSPEDTARMRTILGLDQPLHVQYTRWLVQVMRGNLGTSYQAGLPVTEIVGQMLPNTLVLSAAALLLSLAVAIPAGIVSAARPYTMLDHAVTFLCFFGISNRLPTAERMHGHRLDLPQRRPGRLQASLQGRRHFRNVSCAVE